jgi:hypothetical protein
MMRSFTPKYRGDDYLEQWERVKRWYKKVKEIESNLYQRNGTSIEEQEDYMYVFFLQLYNLKDWVKKSAQEKTIEALFDKNSGIESLQVVADFVANVKHFQNSKTTRRHPDTYFVGRDAQAGGPGPTHTWWIQSGESKKINAYQLADESYNEIEKFMIQKRLVE